MVFCEFLALRWETYGTGILANPINERYTKPRLYILPQLFILFAETASDFY